MKPEMMVAGLNKGMGLLLENAVGPVLTGASKVVGSKPVMKALQEASKQVNKLGIPDFKYWKFSEATRISTQDSKYGGVFSSIIKDMNVKEDILKNMSKYLHTSYEIFKNSKFQVSSEVYDKAVSYFAKLMQTMPKYKKMNLKELNNQARSKVNDILTKGRDEGTTATQRLKAIVNYAEEFVPKGTFKQFYSNNKLLPDEIADLLGRVNDPKKIILDTVTSASKSKSWIPHRYARHF